MNRNIRAHAALDVIAEQADIFDTLQRLGHVGHIQCTCPRPDWPAFDRALYTLGWVNLGGTLPPSWERRGPYHTIQHKGRRVRVLALTQTPKEAPNAR